LQARLKRSHVSALTEREHATNIYSNIRSKEFLLTPSRVVIFQHCCPK
jgi:hypothetical protein